MKLTNLLNLMVLGATLAMTAVGCKTHPYNPKPLLGRPNTIRDPSELGNGHPLNQANPIDRTPFGSRDIPPNTGGEHVGWIPNFAALQSQTVYFEFDKSSIKSSEQTKLEAVANYLQSHGRVAVRVEGNCDERGTEEYNRSLGERRALAAREYLAHLGISADRVDTTTNGEDKPSEVGHNESAWSKNRRDEFVVLTPP